MEPINNNFLVISSTLCFLTVQQPHFGIYDRNTIGINSMGIDRSFCFQLQLFLLFFTQKERVC